MFNIDLLIGGSPCQGFSVAGKGLNFNDPRSKLFFEFVKALKILKPKYFLLENVKMKKEWADIISEHLGVEPIEINSALVSAQNRRRLYWTNIPNVTQPENKHIYLKDILESGFVDREKSYCIDANYYRAGDLKSYFLKKRRQLVFEKPERIGIIGKGSQEQRIYSIDGKNLEVRFDEKTNTLTTVQKDNLVIEETLDDFIVRRLTPVECERLQTLPDNYTEGVSNTQRYKMLGNGWTVDVIAHIFSFIPEQHLHTVVNLFDGISCGQVALERAGKTYDYYYASEIDKYAIQITQKNYPNTIQLGDVTQIDWGDFLVKLSVNQL